MNNTIDTFNDTEALQRLDAVALQIDLLLSPDSCMSDTLALCARLQGKFDVIEPGRRLIKYGDLIRLSPRRPPEMRTLVLVFILYLHRLMNLLITIIVAAQRFSPVLQTKVARFGIIKAMSGGDYIKRCVLKSKIR